MSEPCERCTGDLEVPADARDDLEPRGTGGQRGRLFRCPGCEALWLSDGDDGGSLRRLDDEVALRWLRGALHSSPDGRDEAELVPELEALLSRLAPSDALDPLLDALAGDEPAARLRAADLLGRSGAAASAAVAGLCVALHDPVAGVRVHAAWALGRIGGGAALTGLLAALRQDPSPAVARALGSIGGEAVTRLCEALAEPPAVAGAAATALALLGAESARAPLRARLDALEPRGTAALALYASLLRALGALGGEEDVPRILRALREAGDEAQVRDAARDASARLGRPAVDGLAAALQDQSWQLRWRAAQLLGQLGAAARPAARALKAARKDERPAVAEEAAASLKAIRAAYRG